MTCTYSAIISSTASIHRDRLHIFRGANSSCRGLRKLCKLLISSPDGVLARHSGEYELLAAPFQYPMVSNAFASAFKELDPILQFKATAKLGEFLEARFSQSF